MTAPAYRGEPHPLPYTADEVLSWPEDGLRHEVIDGSLLVSPHAANRHQFFIQRLSRVIDRALPGQDWDIAAPANLRLSPDRLLVPDLVVVSRADMESVYVDPTDVELIVE